MITPERSEHFIFSIADGTAKFCGRGHEVRESPSKAGSTCNESRSQRWPSRKLGESQPTETHDDADVRNDFWSIEGDFTYRHHTELRVHLHVPKEESFPTPLKYLTHTSLDVLQEKRINDYFDVDVDRTLSDTWKGFTKFTFMKEKLPPGYKWSRRRLTKIQATTRSDYLWPEIWIGMSKAAKKKDKQEWALMLEN